MIKKIYGYVTTEKIGNFLIPIPFQNIILVDYSNKKNLRYFLPSTELVIKDYFLSLYSTIKQMDNKSALGICSILVLPKNKKKLKDIFKLIKKKQINIHCVYEKLILNDFDEYQKNIYEYELDEKIKNIENYI